MYFQITPRKVVQIEMTSFEGDVPSFLFISYPTAYGPMQLQKVRVDGMGEFVNCDNTEWIGNEKKKNGMELYALVNSIKDVKVQVKVEMNVNTVVNGDEDARDGNIEKDQEKQVNVDLSKEEKEEEEEEEEDKSIVCC